MAGEVVDALDFDGAEIVGGFVKGMFSGRALEGEIVLKCFDPVLTMC
jgi:hypothetical protein